MLRQLSHLSATLIGAVLASVTGPGAMLPPLPKAHYRGATPARLSRKKFGYAKGLVQSWARARAHGSGAHQTYVGRNPDGTRRVWVAGVSAGHAMPKMKRGYRHV